MSVARTDLPSLALELGGRALLAIIAFVYFLDMPPADLAVSLPLVVAGLVIYIAAQASLFARRLLDHSRWPALVAALVDLVAAAGVVASDPYPVPPTLLLVLAASLNTGLRRGLLPLLLALAGAVATVVVALLARSALYGDEGSYALLFLLAFALPVLLYVLLLGLRQDALADIATKFVDQDPETLLLNRRGFDNAASYLVPLHHRTQLPLVVMIASIDRRDAQPLEPKLLGQAVRQFGQAVRGRARRSDVVARLGNDEFAFLLFDTPPAGAEFMARAVHARFDAWSQQNGGSARLTFSLVNTPVEPVAVDQLIARARSAIQRAQKHPSSPTVVTAPSL